MKKIKKIYYFSFVVLMSLSSYSQVNKTEENYRKNNLNTFDLRSNEIEGSNYLVENFLPAKLSNNEKNYLLRYNAYKDEMEYEKDGKFYYLPKIVGYNITFLDSNKVYQVFTYKDHNSSKNGFFVVLLNSEEISLLIKEKIKVYKKVEPIIGYDKSNPPKLKRFKDKLYIGNKKYNTARSLPKKKKDVLKLFSSKDKEIEAYAKSNNLKFKNTDDLIKIFTYYDSLK